jgi:hypothetical protein
MGRRGRPRLGIKLHQIVDTVRRHRNVMASARELGCSDAYIHAQFKRAGLSLRNVLETNSVGELMIKAHQRRHRTHRSDGRSCD